jgi:hypothetical protein
MQRACQRSVCRAQTQDKNSPIRHIVRQANVMHHK